MPREEPTMNKITVTLSGANMGDVDEVDFGGAA